MPFIKTALLGSPGASVLPKGDYINHFNQIRARVTGSGVLRGTLYSMDDVNSYTLPTITMAATSNSVAAVLANFMEQRCSLKLETTAIDEIFKINRITIYARPVFAEYPR